jgi:hypothetical protein
MPTRGGEMKLPTLQSEAPHVDLGFGGVASSEIKYKRIKEAGVI